MFLCSLKWRLRCSKFQKKKTLNVSESILIVSHLWGNSTGQRIN